MVRSRDLGHRVTCRVGLPHRVQSLACAGAEGPMTASEIMLTPGCATLADWRAIAAGAGVRLDPAALPAIEASVRTVDAIVAKGEPVYGINTGFGKLASVHIPAGDLATLQRHI